MSSNEITLKQKAKSYLKTPGSLLVMLLVMFSAIITFTVLIFLIVYILVHGVPYLKPSLFSLHYNSENASLMPALINTVIMTFFFTAHCGATWYFFRDFSCRICKAWK